MQIQGDSNTAYQLQIKSAQLSQNQQEQEGKAAIQLVESSALPVPVGNSGTIINTYA